MIIVFSVMHIVVRSIWYSINVVSKMIIMILSSTSSYIYCISCQVVAHTISFNGWDHRSFETDKWNTLISIAIVYGVAATKSNWYNRNDNELHSIYEYESNSIQNNWNDKFIFAKVSTAFLNATPYKHKIVVCFCIEINDNKSVNVANEIIAAETWVTGSNTLCANNCYFIDQFTI